MSDARFAQEFGYHVTLIRDAIGAFSAEEITTTFDINAPTYAHAIVTTREFLGALEGTSETDVTPDHAGADDQTT